VGEGERGYTIGARLEEEGSTAAAAREGRDEGGDVEMMVGMEEEDDGGIGSLVMDSEVSSGGVSLDISRQLSSSTAWQQIRARSGGDTRGDACGGVEAALISPGGAWSPAAGLSSMNEFDWALNAFYDGGDGGGGGGEEEGGGALGGRLGKRSRE
jgi:hypothetical protein